MPKKDVGITAKKEQNFSEWYTQVIQKGDLIDYTDVSGCYVFKPNAYSIWEKVQKFFDEKIKVLGVKNAYFPMFIPESLLKKEAKHVEGFKAEVAWVTESGESKLSERLAIRPTSETIMYETYRRWIRSYRDLPLKLNQWCNVVRWEFKNPVPFLRTREFLWQEGHTVFASQKEAEKEVLQILEIYRQVFEELYAVPVIKGKKSEKEKFPGAVYTTSVETFLPNGRAVQGATSHFLGQNFSKAFDITFLDESEKKQHPYQNSWGISTRTIGIMVMMHGDDKGLVIPPRVASVHAVIVPIFFSSADKSKVIKEAKRIKEQLQGYEVILDAREEYTPGWKFNEWELKGVPVRIEIGPNDIKKRQAVIVRRDNGEKEAVKVKGLNAKLRKVLDDMQKSLFAKAKKWLNGSIVESKDWGSFVKAIEDKKMAKALWCSSEGCEGVIKEKTHGAKSILIPFNQMKRISGKCVQCKKPAKAVALFAKSY